jgi:NifU-like protein involved in Fe-S cluster formation
MSVSLNCVVWPRCQMPPWRDAEVGLEYSQKVADYFAQPINIGVPDGDPASLYVGQAGNREHGVLVVFHMRVVDQKIEDIRFQAFACPHTIAACCQATEVLTGAPVRTLLDVNPDDLSRSLDAPTEKMGRMLVVQDALRNCFVAWENRP